MVRRAAEASIFLLIAAIAARAWLVEGLIAPVRVSSGSMAESILGPHVSVRCAACGIEFACDALELPEPFRAVCPQCGFVNRGAEHLVRWPGDRLVLDKLTFALRAPRRWETIVFRCPRRPTEYCIKRVIGLPGETVSIHDGDVFVDGRRVRKSLDELAALAVPVFDTRFQPSSNPESPPRWRPLSASTAWVETAAGFRFGGSSAKGGHERKHHSTKDWLWYCHAVRIADGAFAESVVTDNYGFNQRLSRQLNQVRDLLVIADVTTNGDGVMSLMATYAGGDFMIDIVPAGGLGQLYRNGKAVKEFRTPRELFSEPVTVRLALVDYRILLAIDGRNVIQYDIEPPPSGSRSALMHSLPSAAARPVGIGVAGLAVEITNLRLLRDVFYTDLARGQSARAEAWKLGPDEFFVLGDNSPISRDSRLGPSEFVPTALILGKPLLSQRHVR